MHLLCKEQGRKFISLFSSDQLIPLLMRATPFVVCRWVGELVRYRRKEEFFLGISYRGHCHRVKGVRKTVVKLRKTKVMSADAGEREWRTVKVNNEEQDTKFCSNEVISSKFTSINFIPLALLGEFKRAANLYFLLICVLQTVKAISITNGIPTMAPTLVFVLTLSLIKIGYEDYLRHKADGIENGQEVDVFDNATKTFQKKTWKECKVGNIIQIKNRGFNPCDIVLLASADSKTNAVFINTKALDGETDLKIREVHKDMTDTAFADWSPEQIAASFKDLSLRGEPSSKNLLKFEGSFVKPDGTKVALDMNNVVLRGVQIRQVEWCLGVVGYTGQDTKIQRNSLQPPKKISNMAHWTSIATFKMFLIDILLCSLSALVSAIQRGGVDKNLYFKVGGTDFYMTSMRDKPYGVEVPGDDSYPGGFMEFILTFFTYFIIFTSFIPISLLVTIDFVKFFQKFTMQWDLDMYYEETDTPMRVRCSDLSESLGMVNHVFSDKTGTLTCNVMEFRKCSINGKSYGAGMTQIGIGRFQRLNPGKPVPIDPVFKGPKTEFVNFLDDSLKKLLKMSTEEAKTARRFCLNLALNHEVVPEVNDGKFVYSGPSPDEVAFVYMAKHMGFFYKNRTRKTATVEINGKEEEYDILEVLKFSSARKRSSILCRKTGTSGDIIVFCKGADNVMTPLLNKSCAKTKKMMPESLKHIQQYSDDGLRILMIAEKTISNEWYLKWKERFEVAKNAEVDRDLKKEELMAEIEGGLSLCGVTAIEDKLQDGVPECISSLRKGGIKVWVLTGDKVDTAINIGYACQVISPDMKVIQLTSNAKGISLEVDKDGIPTQMCLNAVLAKALAEGEKAVKDGLEVVAVLDTYFLTSIEMYGKGQDLLKLANMCKSFIAARVSPDQKGQIVTLVRNNSPDTVVTLAIGDGANDVNMIQKAHVGVGIEGLEGKQAVNNSDFAIAQFRYLKKMLICHGRWNYRRMAIVVYYMFYKNALFVIPQWFNGWYSHFSGQPYYLEWPLYQLHNMAWTAFPIIIFGVFDMDLRKQVSMQIPEVFKDGLDQIHFNGGEFIKWIGEAIYHAIVCAIVGIAAVRYNVGGWHSTGVYYTGTIVHLSITVVTNIRLMLIYREWNWIVFFIYFGTFLSWFLFMFILGSTKSPGILSFMTNLASSNTVGMAEKVLPDPVCWLCVVVATGLCLLPAFASKAYKNFYKTRVSTMCQELQQKHAKALGLNSGDIIGCSASLTDSKSSTYALREFGPDESGRVVEMTGSVESDKALRVTERLALASGGIDSSNLNEYEKRLFGLN